MPYFDGRRGRIFHDSWLPDDEARCAVLVLHGYGEHLGLYDPLARRLVTDGHAVHAFDAVGHGRSDGERAVLTSWDHVVDDACTLIGLVRTRHPASPVVVVGHSGGAVTATLLALREPHAAEALVLSAGPLCPQDWINAELATGASEIGGGDPTEFLSAHPDYVHALLHDPLTWKGGFRREMLLALRETWPEVASALAAGRLTRPVLVVHGEADPVVPVEHSHRVVAQLPRGALRTFPGDLHDVLNEHDRDAVHDVIAEFVNAIAVRVGGADTPESLDRRAAAG
jgi:alpha-beta hydrolase superfamily lysophospholipase